MAKIRLDALIHSRGLVPSREKARALVLAGQVTVDGQMVDKPGTAVDENSVVELASPGCAYVSRGGLKLEKALQVFDIDAAGAVVLDIGASTGGYTDCALQQGAQRVYALDVGYGQLDWKLRNDPRVISMERTNIRHLEIDKFPEKVDLVTIDVSFISTSFVFPIITHLVKPEGNVVSLIKPQFEAGRDKVGRKGVVRDQRTHMDVLLKSIVNAAGHGLNCVGITFSPITGPQGNIEFFLHLKKDVPPGNNWDDQVQQLVEQAHQELGGRHSG